MGVIGVGLFGFGVYVATERGQGWLLLKRVSPMPPLMYFLAKTMMSILFSCIVVGVILSIALGVARVDMGAVRVLQLFAVLVLATVPFCSLGLAIAYLVGPNSAHAVINVVYLPQLFLGGIVVPYEKLPAYLQVIASILPSFHSVHLAFGAIDSEHTTAGIWNVLALSCYTVLFLAIALYRYYTDEGKTYG
jgi:ABC-2 type transport system permease protein